MERKFFAPALLTFTVLFGGSATLSSDSDCQNDVVFQKDLGICKDSNNNTILISERKNIELSIPKGTYPLNNNLVRSGFLEVAITNGVGEKGSYVILIWSQQTMTKIIFMSADDTHPTIRNGFAL